MKYRMINRVGLSGVAYFGLLYCCPMAHGQQVEPVAECIEGYEPLPMNYGEHTSGCGIYPATDIDTFEFSGVEGDVVRVIVDGTTNGLDPHVEILDCTGGLVTQGTCIANSVSSCSLIVQATLPCTGEHTVVMSDDGANTTGTYTLQLERIPPAVPPARGCFNASVIDSLNPSTDCDFLEFEGVAGTMIRVQVHGTTNGLDPRLEIVDPQGDLITDNHCEANSVSVCSFEVERTLELTGLYHLMISEWGANQSGNYQVTLQCIFGNCACLQRDLNDDGTVNVLDLLLVLAAWGQTGDVPEDLNCDDIVDVLDILAILSSWGDC